MAEPSAYRITREDGTYANTADALVPGSVKGGGYNQTAAAAGAAISTTVPCSLVMIQNIDTTLSITWGGAAGQYITVLAGQNSGFIPISDAMKLYVKEATGAAKYSWIAL